MIILNKGLYSTFNTTFLCGVKPPTPEFTAGAYGAHPNPAASGLNAAKTWGSESGSLMQRCTNPINGGLFVVRSPSLVPTFEFSCSPKASTRRGLRLPYSCASSATLSHRPSASREATRVLARPSSLRPSLVLAHKLGSFGRLGWPPECGVATLRTRGGGSLREPPSANAHTAQPLTPPKGRRAADGNPNQVRTYFYKWSAESQLRSCSSNLTKKGERGPPLTELSVEPAGSTRLSLGAAARTVRGIEGDNHNGEVLETLLRQETGGKPSSEQQPLKGECSPVISHARGLEPTTQTHKVMSGISQLVNLTPGANGKYVNLTEIVADPDVLLAAYEKLKLSQHELNSTILSLGNDSLGPLPRVHFGIDWNWFNDASRHLLNGSYSFRSSRMRQNVAMCVDGFAAPYGPRPPGEPAAQPGAAHPIERRQLLPPRPPASAKSATQPCARTPAIKCKEPPGGIVAKGANHKEAGEARTSPRTACCAARPDRVTARSENRMLNLFSRGDLVVQFVIRMVLERIYEPIFCDHSHGFRPNRGSALKDIKNTWNGISWLLEFEVKKSFDRMYLNRLIFLLKDKIHDQRFLDIIHKMFNSALSVQVQQSCTKEGLSPEEIVPVLSPLLSNIYMDLLDREALEVHKDYCVSTRCAARLLPTVTTRKPKCAGCSLARSTRSLATYPTATWAGGPTVWRPCTRVCKHVGFTRPTLEATWSHTRGDQARSLLSGRAVCKHPRLYYRRLNKKFRKTVKVTSAERRQLKDDDERITALKVGRRRIARRRGLTLEDYRDEEFIQVKYIRYANDFLFGIAGSRQLVEIIGHRILYFLKVNMELEVNLFNYVHVTGGRVEFLGVYIYSVPALKWPTKSAKSVEKRRRIRNRLKIFAEQRKDTLAHQLKKSVLNAWAWGLKKSKSFARSEAAKQAMYAKAATFDIGKIEHSETLKQLLKEEQDVFSRTAWKEFPEEVKKAYDKLFEALEKHVNEEVAGEGVSTHSLLRGGWSSKARPSNHAPQGVVPMGPHIDQSLAVKGQYFNPIRLVVPLDQLMKKLRSKGVITQRKSRPSVVGFILYLPDERIVHWFSSLAYEILNYYRCCDNFYMVKNLVDYQIRWSAIFTLTAKHKSTTKKTIKTYTIDLRIRSQRGTEIASFPSSSMIKAMNKTFQYHSGGLAGSPKGDHSDYLLYSH